MKLALQINEGTLAGKKFVLESGFLTVGRGESCTVRFDSQTETIASKKHAYIEAKTDGFYLTDNQSTNGTFLNGQKIETSKLSAGDRIQFGKNGVTATVYFEGNARPAFQTPISHSANKNASDHFRSLQPQQISQQLSGKNAALQNSLVNFGVSRGVEKTSANQTGKFVAVGIAVFAIVFLSLIVILLMFASVGVGAAVLASFVAFIPAMFYVLPLIWLDRYDPEPVWLLSLAFAWGALVAVIVSFIVNSSVGFLVFQATQNPNAAELIGSVVSAPIFEEGSKGLGVVALLIFFRRYFDDILDGIIFAGVIALGFATVENVLYYGRGISQGGSDQLLLLFVMRGIMSPFAHVTFTAMTGIGCGIARESHNTAVRLAMPILGYVCAVILHAVWNGMAFVGGLGGFIVGYILLEIPFFLLFVGFTFYIMRRQNKILREMLAIDIARGTIPPQHTEKAMSVMKSSVWILSGLFGGKFRARSNYIRAVGKLGLSQWHIQRATAAQGKTESFQQNPLLREEVLRWRDMV
jgi:RsiW-degrading membrane proteinase PrsW (M82 family)/pSer/pThr/pTyr-binding forkhead associated (FHA) protein